MSDWDINNMPGLKNCGPLTFEGRFLAPHEAVCVNCAKIFTLPVDGPIPHATDITGATIGAMCDVCAMAFMA